MKALKTRFRSDGATMINPDEHEPARRGRKPCALCGSRRPIHPDGECLQAQVEALRGRVAELERELLRMETDET